MTIGFRFSTPPSAASFSCYSPASWWAMKLCFEGKHWIFFQCVPSKHSFIATESNSRFFLQLSPNSMQLTQPDSTDAPSKLFTWFAFCMHMVTGNTPRWPYSNQTNQRSSKYLKYFASFSQLVESKQLSPISSEVTSLIDLEAEEKEIETCFICLDSKNLIWGCSELKLNERRFHKQCWNILIILK